MNNITYVDVPARKEIRVFVGGRRTGTIVTMANVLNRPVGYQYRAKGSTHLNHGETFKTVEECKASLERP